MRFISLFSIGLMLLVSCATVNQGVRLSRGSDVIESDLANKIAGNGSIKLLTHQLLVIDYLKKHPEQKGLLVNHYMGTGKTYLGIGYAQLYPELPVLVLAPRFLESNWVNSIKSYGAEQKRFSFVAYEDAPAKLAHLDLSKHLILADEVHNLVKRMRSIDRESNKGYTEVYTKLRGAYKILGLTGTPIYSDESDIAFLLNLVSGKDLMPFNQEAFRLQYTHILSARQFFRGYLTESNLMVVTLPMFMGVFMAAAISPVAAVAGIPLGIGLTVGVNHLWGPPAFKLRELDAVKMTPILQQYVSYFSFAPEHFKDFPPQDFKIEEVPYNKYQYSFFLRLIEGDLPVDQLQRLLENEQVKRSDEYVKINSTSIHEQIYSAIGAGRDIGNFEFKDADLKIVEAPKFVRIYEELMKNNDQTVIYSNYYQTGILAFEQFLKRQGYQHKYAIIDPSMPMEKVSEIVASYNQGETKLLMLHPEVTEGISLKGTQYLHILEPMLNSTVLEQVVGRTRRFQSHSHLAKDKQLVKVRMWQSSSSNWDPEIGGINRVNWYKRYRELAYMAGWGIGIHQIDKKIDRKALNPEELALLKLRTLEKNLTEIQKVLTDHSIENNYQQ